MEDLPVSVNAPVGAIVKRFWTPLEKKLFLDFFLQSHSYGSEVFESGWMKADCYFEIRFILKYALLRQQYDIPFSEIEIRNISGKKLKQIKLTVITKDWFKRERRQFIDVGNMENLQMLPFSLPNIPLVDILFTKNGIVCSHKNLSVILHSLEEDKILKIIDKKIFEPILLVHSTLLNDTWIKKWGCYWNFNFIRRAQGDFAAGFYYLSKHYAFIHWIYDFLGEEYHEQSLIKKILRNGIKYSLRSIFWFLLITKMYKINEDGRLCRNG